MNDMITKDENYILMFLKTNSSKWYHMKHVENSRRICMLISGIKGLRVSIYFIINVNFWIAVFAGLARVDPHVQINSPVKNQIIKYRNQSVLFNCTVTLVNITSGTNFVWLRNNRLINPPGKRDTQYWSSFVLTGGLQAQDEGEYSCSYNDGDPATVIVHLAGNN